MNAQSKELAPANEALPVDPTLLMIERVVLNPDADLNKVRELLDLQERREAAQAKQTFDMAFSQASADFPDIPMSGHNQHTKKPYATLKDITATVRPHLTKYGLALSFSATTGAEAIEVTAELSHSSGHTKRNTITLPFDTGAGRNRVQAIGSSQTYGQRYAAQALLGLSLGDDTEDDGSKTGPVEERQRQKSLNWEQTIVAELPEEATHREKAKAIADAITAQWGRMKGVRQIDNEWDRRAHLIDKLEADYKAFWETVIGAYEARRAQLAGET